MSEDHMFPDYPQISKEYRTGACYLRTCLRVKHSDGIFYRWLFQQAYHLNDKERITASERLFRNMEKLVMEVYFTQHFGIVAPELRIDAEKKHPIFVPDRDQREEADRLMDRYPHLKETKRYDATN